MKGLSNCLTLMSSLLFVASIASTSCTSATVQPPSREAITSQTALNINAADLDSLQALPGIGPQLAAKIIEHRTRYGPFRKTEHLLIVEGISEKRFRDVEKLVTTD